MAWWSLGMDTGDPTLVGEVTALNPDRELFAQVLLINNANREPKNDDSACVRRKNMSEQRSHYVNIG